ncbi:MAG: hypothetical protein H7A45_08745 [Verrucomicrobiales bacterium]|nr:hypothetical protein [Verrucomicrobiales bacterium]
MKHRSCPPSWRPSAGAFVALTLLAGRLWSQTPSVVFDCGSTGELGDVVIDAPTLIALPPDGILHYRSLHVQSGGSVSFIKNAANTPVYILSQGDVTIEGVLIVAGGNSGGSAGPGLGGPGGFDGGQHASGEAPPGDGRGPGGGRAGNDGSASAADSAGSAGFLDTGVSAGSNRVGPAYGNPALIPLLGGSGGGGTPTYGGGGGGGALLLASNTRIVFAGGSASVDASGGSNTGAWNGGSGGAVKLVAPHVTGPTRINVSSRAGSGSPGRVRVDAADFSGWQGGAVSPGRSLSYGSMLATGLEGDLPRLELVSVGGRNLPEGSVANGFILLPNGSAEEQAVVIRAHNFGTQVPVNVVVSPDNGATFMFPGVIDNRAENPATATITATMPANTPVNVYVWTR